MKPSYAAFKKYYRRLMKFLPGGSKIHKATHRLKTMLKQAILNCSMFEDMGLQYTGPVDGHNIERLIGALEWAKQQDEPTVVHVLTKKGRGYDRAEQAPEDYHGVAPFDCDAGLAGGEETTFSSVFGEELAGLAERDSRICAITASMTSGTGLGCFAERFPERFFDVGIAEGHAVAMAAGMAICGAVPVFAVYSTFLQRAYDMMLHDVAISGLHVIFAVDRAGLVPGDGETHQGLFDVAYLSSIPGMTVMCPASYAELRDMLSYAVGGLDGPVAVRYPRGCEGGYRDGGADSVRRLREGADFTIVTYGVNVNAALEAAETLDLEGISVEVIKLGRVCPIDGDSIISSVEKTGRLLVLEECSGRGSAGERITALLSMSRIAPESVVLLNTGELFAPCGEIDELRKFCGVDALSVCEAVRSAMRAGME